MDLGVGTHKVMYHGLDALRGVAAVLVVTYHCSMLYGAPIAPSGYLAVDLFFMLSGFVIAHSYDTRLSSNLSIRRFTLIRFVRLWPLYVFGLLIGTSNEVLLLMASNSFAMPARTLVSCVTLGIFLIPTWFHTRFDTLYPLNGPSWSVFLELAVNIVYAIAFRYLSRPVLIGVAVLAAAWLAVNAVGFGSVDWGNKTSTFVGGLVRTIFSFSVGVLLYRLKWRNLKIPLALVLLVVVIALAAPVSAPLRPFYDLGFVFILSPLLVLAAASSSPTGVLRHVGNVLGQASYAVYAIHRPLLSFADTVVKRTDVSRGLATVAFVIGVMALAVALHRLYDTPVRDWLSVRLGLRRVPAPREVSAP